MIPALILSAYGAVAAFVFRWAIRRMLREFPRFGLDTFTVFFAGFVALTWPFGWPTLAAISSHPKPREWKRLRRWAER